MPLALAAVLSVAAKSLRVRLVVSAHAVFTPRLSPVNGSGSPPKI
jgi:hypothetical protein